jgi:hypothetical protein
LDPERTTESWWGPTDAALLPPDEDQGMRTQLLGDMRELDRREPHRARHAFQHPFAYADLSWAA